MTINSDLHGCLSIFRTDIVQHGFHLQDAIERRKEGRLDVDNGSRYGWAQQSGKSSSSAIDLDAELIYLHLPGALDHDEIVRIIFLTNIVHANQIFTSLERDVYIFTGNTLLLDLGQRLRGRLQWKG